jgi:putative membrane protein
MNLKSCTKWVPALVAFFMTASAHAETVAAPTWHAQTLTEAILNMLLFAAIGIAAAIIGFKVFDKCTPGDLAREIVENKNVAAAILSAAVVLGVCLIIAAAMMG